MTKCEPKFILDRNKLICSLGTDLVVGEVGVFRGEFSKYIHHKTQPKELHLFDIFENTCWSTDPHGRCGVDADLSIQFEELKDYFSDNHEVIFYKGKSCNTLPLTPDNYFDWLYIDGEHSYETLTSDLEIGYTKIKPGGYLLGHDYNPNVFPEVVRAVDDFCTKYNLKISILTQELFPSFAIRCKL